MNLVSRARGAQLTPAGVLILPLDGATAPAEVLEFLRQQLNQLAPAANVSRALLPGTAACCGDTPVAAWRRGVTAAYHEKRKLCRTRLALG